MLALLNCRGVDSRPLHNSRKRAGGSLAGGGDSLITNMNWIRYFATDKYAVYVWGSYAVTFVLLAGEVLMLLKRKRNLAKRAAPQPVSSESRLNTSLQGVQ